MNATASLPAHAMLRQHGLAIATSVMFTVAPGDVGRGI